MSRITITTRRRIGGGSLSAPAPVPAVTSKQTEKGTEVSVDSNNEALREAARLRVQKEMELEEAKKLAQSRRQSATLSADLKNRALAIEVGQRQVNIGREQARLKRESRLAISGVLSRAAQGDVTQTSAFKASRIAARSLAAGEADKITQDETRNQSLDQIRREEISANLEANLASNQDPVNVFLNPNTETTNRISRTYLKLTTSGSL